MVKMCKTRFVIEVCAESKFHSLWKEVGYEGGACFVDSEDWANAMILLWV